MLDIVGIAAVEKRAPGEGCVGILTGHARDPVLSNLERFSSRSLSPRRVCSTLRRLVLCKLRLRAGTAAQPDQPLSASARVLPSRAGEGETLIPAASIAAIFDSASPLPPEMIAPACPMRRPGGAVRPAMKPTIGFLRPRLA